MASARVNTIREALKDLEHVEKALLDAQARIPMILGRAREARRKIEEALPKDAAPGSEAAPK